MLRSAAVARIQRGLGFRTDQTDNIISALQEAQRLLERGRTLPFFLLSEASSLVTVAGTSLYNLPTRFLREQDDNKLRYVASTGGIVFLEKMTNDKQRALFWDIPTATFQVGAPLSYAIRKTQVRLIPTPDAVYTLSWGVYIGAEPLSADIENAWLEEESGAPEVLINRAGMLLAEDLGNEKALERFTKKFGESWAGMFGDTTKREEENMPLEMGSSM